MIRLFRVRGRSMLPTLADGDFVVAWRLGASATRRLSAGQVVCLTHPHFGALIKRIASVDTNTVRVDSDGQTGAEGASFGDVSLSAITHRAVFVIPARGRCRAIQ